MTTLCSTLGWRIWPETRSLSPWFRIAPLATSDPAIGTLQEFLFERLGADIRATKEATAVPFQLLVLVERAIFTNTSSRPLLSLFLWQLLMIVWRSLRFDVALHTSPRDITMREEDGSESSQNENSSLTENDECHDLSDFPPAQAAGCQLDPECLENYDLWEFVVSKVAVEAMNGRMMVAHMKLVGCDQLLCNRLPVTVCHNFGRRQPAFCRLCERCCAISS